KGARPGRRHHLRGPGNGRGAARRRGRRARRLPGGHARAPSAPERGLRLARGRRLLFRHSAAARPEPFAFPAEAVVPRMNFSFLAPAFLWALPLAAAPVVIHWLNSARPRRLPFSSIEVLRASAQSRLLRSRLAQFLLLAARVFLLASL